jgi:tetratricopeptide (TPR) repeat protein
MRFHGRKLVLGACAAAMLAGVATGGWVLLVPRTAQTAEETLPLPPEPPRLADGPEMERCLALLQTAPEDARGFATRWEREGGGDGARHCGALATLALGDAAGGAERLEALARASGAGGAARAAVFAQAAQAWLIARDPNRAFGATTMALTLAPDDPDLLIDRAVALGILRRYREAIADLDRVLAIDAQRPDALVFRAAAWRQLDRFEAALRDVGRALAIAPDHPEALLERGILRQIGGDTDGARADWERAIAVAPNSATADLAAQNLALNEAGPFRR